MSSVNYENQILDAIETMVDSAISKAGYDKTIKGTIISLEDAAIGKYKIKYQDSEIEAYSNNTSIIYPNGILVYVSIPENDFTQTKTIIGAVNRNNLEYTTILDNDNVYNIEGGNAIAATQEFGLCSYHENEIKYLYNRNNGINLINLNLRTLSESIETSTKILCGAKFKTTLNREQRKEGNYGIGYELDFKDNVTGAIITKDYKIDINNFLGTPYDLNNFTRQYVIFEINSENFVGLKSIYIFCNNFPETSVTIQNNDIFFKNFELYGLTELTEEELNGYNLQLKKNKKGYFDSESIDTDIVTIEAVLKEHGKESNNIEIDYYWFKENNNITATDDTYIHFGGNGWECINRYNKIDDSSNMWLTKDKKCDITKIQCKSDFIHIKCVAVKNNEIIAEKIIKIHNYNPEHTIDIISNQGTKFYFDNGNPTLTCKIDGVEDLDYTYIWSSIDNNGITTILNETTTENIAYNQTLEEYQQLINDIEDGTEMPAANQSTLNNLENTLKNYEYIQRIEKNKIYCVDISQIFNFTTFKCMVKKQNTIIGIATITLSNILNVEGEYKLNIINGIQTFNYTYAGISPTNQSIEKPIIIEPLSFEITDNLGNSLGENILRQCEVQWEVPNEDTLLIGNNSTALTLNYSIADKYDNKKLINNNIKLTVKYKGTVLKAETMFTFVKDGEPGTNGTDIICKIVPNTNEIFNEYPMLINGIPNFTPAASSKWFKVELWENGQMIWNGINSDTNHTVKWSILKNLYERNVSGHQKVSEPTNITVNTSTGEFSYSGTYNANTANIIKVEVIYSNRTYYCTLPLIISDISDTSIYTIKLIANTGFRYAMYSNDGKRPQYNNVRPFELQVTQVINDYIEDISNINNNYKPTYHWNPKGIKFNVTNNDFVNDINLIAVPNSELSDNQKFFIPKNSYDGENITNAIEVEVKDNIDSTTIGKILIPIHFYLDKYGISALNDWDGNKILLDDVNGGMILSPQVGAGQKNDDNTFSGVLIGSVKERQSNTINQGLFGYYHGQRSIFLDSNTGKAEFGLGTSGKIIIDPSQSTQKALIYGGNYIQASSGVTGSGMLIDLSTPEIKFGTDKFNVNSGGELTATGATITGAITATSLTLGNNVTIPSGKIDGLTTAIDNEINVKIPNADKILYRGDVTHNRSEIKDSNNNVIGYSDTTSFKDSTGTIQSYTTYTASASDGYVYTNVGLGTQNTSTHASNYVKISKNGLLEADNAIIYGTIYAGAGQIGGWNINSSSLSKGKVGLNSNNSADTNIAIWAGNTTASSAPFRVTYGGALTATSATITGAITATSLTLNQGVTIPSNKIDGLTTAIDTEINTQIPNLNKILYQGDVTHTRTTSSDGHLITDTTSFIDSTGTTQSYTTYTSTSDGYVYTDVGLGTQNTSTHTSNYCKISKQGLLTADNAIIYGTIYAGAGQIGGWNIGSSKIYSTNNDSQVTGMSSSTWPGDPIFYAGGGDPWSTQDWRDSVPFYVTNQGVIKATSGTIGAFTLDANSLYSGSGNNTAGIGVFNRQWAFWAGSSDGSTAPFRVGHGGAVTASNITITGGSLTIGNDFSVTNSGALTCSGATINGNLVTSSGVLSYMFIDAGQTVNEDYFGENTWNFLGFVLNDEYDSNKIGANYTFLEFNINIPSDFEIINAKIVYTHTPVYWELPTGSHVTGYARDVKVKKVTLSNTSINASYGSEFWYDDNASTTNVDEAGSAITFSSSVKETKSTSNFANAFKSGGVTQPGAYCFRAISTYTRPAEKTYNPNTSTGYQTAFNQQSATCAPLTGWCTATLEIVGYKKYS